MNATLTVDFYDQEGCLLAENVLIQCGGGGGVPARDSLNLLKPVRDYWQDYFLNIRLYSAEKKPVDSIHWQTLPVQSYSLIKRRSLAVLSRRYVAISVTHESGYAYRCFNQMPSDLLLY